MEWYNFVSRPDSLYSLSIHNHGFGDLGFDLDSTSHIEQSWSQLKTIIKQIYNIILLEKYFLFIREAEFRLTRINLNNIGKVKEFIDIIFYIKNIDILN